MASCVARHGSVGGTAMVTLRYGVWTDVTWPSLRIVPGTSVGSTCSAVTCTHRWCPVLGVSAAASGPVIPTTVSAVTVNLLGVVVEPGVMVEPVVAMTGWTCTGEQPRTGRVNDTDCVDVGGVTSIPAYVGHDVGPPTGTSVPSTSAVPVWPGARKAVGGVCSPVRMPPMKPSLVRCACATC